MNGFSFNNNIVPPAPVLITILLIVNYQKPVQSLKALTIAKSTNTTVISLTTKTNNSKTNILQIGNPKIKKTKKHYLAGEAFTKFLNNPTLNKQGVFYAIINKNQRTKVKDSKGINKF